MTASEIYAKGIRSTDPIEIESMISKLWVEMDTMDRQASLGGYNEP